MNDRIARLARWTMIYDELSERIKSTKVGDGVTLSLTEVVTLLNYGKQFMEADSPLDDTEKAILDAKLYRAGCAGHFVTCLARTFEAADEKHLVRLHSIFPEFGAALWRLKTNARSLEDDDAERAPDVRAILKTLGFDPTNHHNAAKCPYCRE